MDIPVSNPEVRAALAVWHVDVEKVYLRDRGQGFTEPLRAMFCTQRFAHRRRDVSHVIQACNLPARYPLPSRVLRASTARTRGPAQAATDGICDFRFQSGLVEFRRSHEEILCYGLAMRLECDHAPTICSEFVFEQSAQAFAAERDLGAGWIAQQSILAAQVKIIGQKRGHPLRLAVQVRAFSGHANQPRKPVRGAWAKGDAGVCFAVREACHQLSRAE